MTPELWLLLAAAGIVVLLLAWAAWTLTRLRRLRRRVDRAWAALDTALQRRGGLADELTTMHADVLGGARAGRLAAAVVELRAPGGGDRELAENALGRELRALPEHLAGVPAALRVDLTETSTRVGLSRRFYNDAVRDTRELRGRRPARLLRLHARRPLPRYFDIDDGMDVVTGSAQ